MNFSLCLNSDVIITARHKYEQNVQKESFRYANSIKQAIHVKNDRLSAILLLLLRQSVGYVFNWSRKSVSMGIMSFNGFVLTTN